MITIEDLNQKQREAFELLEEGNENLFITGAAGTGKSEVISLYNQL